MPSALWTVSPRENSSRPTNLQGFQSGNRGETENFRALLSGEHAISSFSNLDIRKKPAGSPYLKDILDARRQSAKVTRIFNRCHAHGLIAKIPHSRRWRLTKQGRVAMAASIQLRDTQFPTTYVKLTPSA